MFKVFFENVQKCSLADIRRKRVPEGGGCDTKGSVSISMQSGVGGGEQASVRSATAFRRGCRRSERC